MPPISTQPYPGQPYPGQSYPGQPYSGQSYPGQPYPGQPYPAPVYYPGYPGYPQYVQRRGTNGLAIAALVCGIVFSPLGIVFGFVALNQIKQSGEEGRGLALAGIWVGAATLALMVLYFTFFFILFDQFMRNLPPVQ